MASDTEEAGRISSGASCANLVLVIAGVTFAWACTDYSDYSQLRPGSSGGSIQEGTGGTVRDPKDASGTGGRGTQVGSGGRVTQAGSGGRGTQVGSGDAATDTTGKTPSDAGGTLTDAHDASDASSGNSSDADAGVRESGAPRDAGKDVANGTILFTFDRRADYMNFRAVTPLPFTAPGVWAWGIDPYFFMIVTRIAFASANNPTDAYAMYRPGGVVKTFKDARVSVHIRSNNSGPVGVVLRYVSEKEFYRYSVTGSALLLERGEGYTDGATTTNLHSANPVGFNLVAGHQLTFDAKGSQIRAWFDGALFALVDDSKYVEGEIGLYDRGNLLAEFDDFMIEPL